MQEQDFDVTHDPGFEYVVRVRVHDDEAAIVLKGHLLIEYLLNKIISLKCKAPAKILEDSRNYTFSIKLQMVYSMGLLPDSLFENITRINRFRNKLAHNLEVELDSSLMMITNPHGKAVAFVPKGKRYAERHYLKMLCFVTLSALGTHMLIRLKIDPRYSKPSKK